VTLEARTDIAPEDRDLIMQLSPLYLEQIQTAKLEGEQQGKQEQQQEIAVKLLRRNIPLEVISETTGVSIEQLQILRSQPGNN
jgi:predicted transposase/invertase (TIGR01784 family)